MKPFIRWLFYSLAIVQIFALSPEQEQQIKNVIENEFMGPNFTPGVGFSVFYQDDVFASGYGFKDVERNWTADSQTLFGIASMTKSFTATLVVKVLHEKFQSLGNEALDRPISQLIPSFNFTMSDRYRSEALTFRDLLSHKTCLDTLYLGRTFGSIPDAAEFAYRTRFVEEVCPFRTGYTYNNGMYALAGEAIAALANSTFVDLVEDLLLQIGMNDTVLYKPSMNFDEMQHASRGYYRNNGQQRRFNSNLFKRMHIALPSGGLMASSRDIAKYMEFQLNIGRINGRQVVPLAAMRRIHRASNNFDISGLTGLQLDYAYALGLRLGLHSRWPLEFHTGTWPPFTSRMSLFPTLNLGIFTVVNGPGLLTVNHKHVHDRVFEIVTGFETFAEKDIEIRKPENRENELGLPTWKYSNVNVEPEEIEGLYGNAVQGDFTIRYNATDLNGDLYLQYGIWGTGYLRKLTNSNSTYYPLWDSDIVGDFLSQATQLPIVTLDFGNPNVALMVFDGTAIEFKRNATVGTFPTPPWSLGSCSPE